MRYLSSLVHERSTFYAQNVSIIPVYNRVHVKEVVFVPKRYTECNWQIDEDLPIYFNNWREHIASQIAEGLDLYNWAVLNSGGLSISIEEWMNLDMMMREAIKMAGNKVFSDQKKEANRIQADMERKLEQNQPHRSAFEGIPKPSFFQQ